MAGHSSFQNGEAFIKHGGQVGVVVSNVGKDPTEEMKKRLGSTQIGASESAMNFLQSRSEEQAKAESRARADLERYHVECVSVLICQIRLPEDLMQTQTKRIIAEQQQEMYNMEQRSQAERTQMEKMRATAD